MADDARPGRASARAGSAGIARGAVLLLLLTLAGVAILALLQARAGFVGRALLAGLLLLPLALPLPGLVRRDRRTYAWATLCLTPHVIYGLTELVANPALRVHAGSMLLLAVALLVALVAYLRLTRESG